MPRPAQNGKPLGQRKPPAKGELGGLYAFFGVKMEPLERTHDHRGKLILHVEDDRADSLLVSRRANIFEDWRLTTGDLFNGVAVFAWMIFCIFFVLYMAAIVSYGTGLASEDILNAPVFFVVVAGALASWAYFRHMEFSPGHAALGLILEARPVAMNHDQYYWAKQLLPYSFPGSCYRIISRRAFLQALCLFVCCLVILILPIDGESVRFAICVPAGIGIVAWAWSCMTAGGQTAIRFGVGLFLLSLGLAGGNHLCLAWIFFWPLSVLMTEQLRLRDLNQVVDGRT